MEQKTTLIKIGDFFFKYRNFIFPIFLVVLLLGKRPPSEYFGSEEAEDVVDTIAVILALAGLSLRGAVIGFSYIKRGGLNKKVYAENLVTDGFFAVCRNPLYVGNILIYAGLLLKHGDLLVLVLGSAFFLFVYTAIVAAEEYFLRNGFGDAYREYCRDVPRWRMKWPRLKAATEGMKFNLKKALVKDYGTIINVVVTLTILEMLEQTSAAESAEPPNWFMFAAIIGCVIAMGLVVRVAKRRGVLKA
ncbi:MAG: methyltransferase family protein [Rickettsiales bacterium]